MWNGHAIRACLLLVFCGAAMASESDEPVFPVRMRPQEVERLKQRHADLLALTEEELVALVPVQSGIWYTDCPNCDGATQDRGNWNWTPSDPKRITCRDCGEKFPGNERYPDVGQIEVSAPGGPHVYPYWERSGDQYRIFFRAHVDALSREHMDQACRDLARIYAATGDEQIARRAALILLRFAEVYPGYALSYDYPFRAKAFWPHDATEINHPVIRSSPDRLSKYHWWRYVEISQPLVEAYDALRHWPPLKEMDEGRAVQRIEEDLLTAMVDFALGYPDALSNMGPTNWQRAIGAGRVLGRPDYVHEAVDRFERFLTTKFLYDGHWRETSPSYHAQCLGGIRAIRSALSGYSDPEDYQHPESGKRLDEETLKPLFARYDRCLEALRRPRFPDGRLLPINDTWWTGRQSSRSSMESDLSPGLGAAVLGGGERNRQIHAHLNFSSGRGHKHHDSLSIGLFAHGKELLPDVGYTHTAYRSFATSTMSHNTVVVNGVEQQFDPDWSGNRLRAFVSDREGFHVAQAESVSAYPQVQRYRRTLMVLGHDATDAYVIDVFHVMGGKQHDYLLHGSADDDSTATIQGVTMTPFDGTLMNPGVRFREPRGENDQLGEASAFGFAKELSRGIATGVVTLDMRLQDEPELGTRTWLDAGDQTEIYLGEAPSIRRARSSDRDLSRYQAPFFTARRKGEELSSIFVAVHEPVRGKPRIQGFEVQRLPEGVVVNVTTDSGTDHVVIALEDVADVEWQSPGGTVSFRGRFGAIQLDPAGKIRQAHLVGGDLLRLGKTVAGEDMAGKNIVDSARPVAGEVLRTAPVADGVSFGALDVDQPLSESAEGNIVIVHHADGSTQGYHIQRVEPLDGEGTRIFVAEDAGFRYTDNGIEATSYPYRHIPGSISRFEVLPHATYSIDMP